MTTAPRRLAAAPILAAVLLVAALGVAALGCGDREDAPVLPEDPPPSTPVQSPAPSPSPPAPSPTPMPTVSASPTPFAVLEPAATDAPSLQGLGAVAQQIRGLEALRPVKERVIDRGQLAVEVRDQLEEIRGLLERREILLSAIGAIEPDDDLSDIMQGLYEIGVAGFYDSGEEELVIVQDGELGVADMTTYVHEFVHNLQQQHFDIGALSDEREDNTDVSLALRALVEGDAELATAIYTSDFLDDRQRRRLFEELPNPDAGRAMEAIPEVILDWFAFPYAAGARFGAALFAMGGWQAVNRAYSDPPSSTEQILHPDKYLEGEQPAVVDLSDAAAALGGEWSEVFRDTVGEFMISAVLDLELARATASNAGAGWGGDTVSVLSNDAGELIAAWVIAWDSERDAGEFDEAFATYMERRSGARWRQMEGGRAMLIDTGGQVVAIETDGSETAVVYASDEGLAVMALGAARSGG